MTVEEAEKQLAEAVSKMLIYRDMRTGIFCYPSPEFIDAISRSSFFKRNEKATNAIVGDWQGLVHIVDMRYSDVSIRGKTHFNLMGDCK